MRFSECLNSAAENSSDPVAVNALITSVFLEVRSFADLLLLIVGIGMEEE
jgi:hypothetical protein